MSYTFFLVIPNKLSLLWAASLLSSKSRSANLFNSKPSNFLSWWHQHHFHFEEAGEEESEEEEEEANGEESEEEEEEAKEEESEEEEEDDEEETLGTKVPYVVSKMPYIVSFFLDNIGYHAI